MTKKTNSLILRFGLCGLWQNKSAITKNIANKILLENIIYGTLQKKKFHVLKVKYQHSRIKIYIYNNFEVYNNYKSQIIVYYKKVLSLSKTVEKFGLHEKIIIQFLNIVDIKKINLYGKVTYIKNSVVFLLFYVKCFLLRVVILLLSFFKWISLNSFLLLFKCLNILNATEIKNYKKLLYKMSSSKKLRKILGLISLKVFSILLENIFFLTSGFFFKVTIKGIFLTKGLFLIKNIFNFFEKQEFRLAFYFLFLATNYNCTKILSDYLAGLVKRKKNHIKIFKVFVFCADELFRLNLIKFLGLQLRSTGKISGSLRKSKYHFKLGQVKLQKFFISLNYSLSLSYTKFGVISIKVWVAYENLCL